jgi:hypothetical protein
MKNQISSAEAPLVVFVIEPNHTDQAPASLIEEIEKECHEQGLSTKLFSEFGSLVAKSLRQDTRDSDLMNRKTHPESVMAAAQFLDEHLIEMGSISGRNEIYDKSWNEFAKDLTPWELFERCNHQIDNSELLEMVKEDLKVGTFSGICGDKAENIANTGQFYQWWRSPFHGVKIHERMAEDVKTELAKGG